jgi:hypothetical protein
MEFTVQQILLNYGEWPVAYQEGLEPKELSYVVSYWVIQEMSSNQRGW